MSDCPYYKRDYKTCALTGTGQDGYHKDNYCLSGSSWRNCANYQNANRSDKINKKERSNPDL